MSHNIDFATLQEIRPGDTIELNPIMRFFAIWHTATNLLIYVPLNGYKILPDVESATATALGSLEWRCNGSAAAVTSPTINVQSIDKTLNSVVLQYPPSSAVSSTLVNHTAAAIFTGATPALRITFR